MEITQGILKMYKCMYFNFAFNSAPQDPGSSGAGRYRGNACISSKMSCTLITDLELSWHYPLALVKETFFCSSQLDMATISVDKRLLFLYKVLFEHSHCK